MHNMFILVCLSVKRSSPYFVNNIMYGANPKRKIVKGSGETLEVQEIFATIQGEGPNAGTPAVFIRLGGCNLACKFCDAEFESFRKMELTEIISEVKKLAGKKIELVVITGGEPMRQPIELLCEKLLKSNLRVQIETNGTIYRKLDRKVEIVCSPKNNGAGYKPLRADLLPHVNALKFLISDGDEKYRDVPEVGQTQYKIPVYVQPMDEYQINKNKKNAKRAAEIAAQSGCKLSIQLHKILGIP